MKKTPVIIISLLVIVAAIAGFYFFQQQASSNNQGPTSTANNTDTDGTTDGTTESESTETSTDNTSEDSVETSAESSSEETTEESTEETVEETAEEATGEKTTISIGVYPNLDEHIETVLPKFYEENPDIEIEIKTLSIADHHNNLVTAMAAGKGAPDVAALEVGFIAQFAAEGAMTDLSQEPYNALEFQDNFADYAWQQSTTTDGRLIAVPTDLGPGVMFWRRDVFEELGSDVESLAESWDAYIEFGRKVARDTDGDGKKDIFLIPDAADVIWAMVRSDREPGQGIFFDKDNNVLVTTERFQNAFKIAKTIRDEGLDAEIASWTNEWYQAFRKGTVATQFSGAWFQDLLANTAPETSGLWGAANLPGGAYSSWGGSFYGIPEQSENKEAAWKLLTFLTTTENIQMEAFTNISAFPSFKSAWENPVFDEPIEFLGDQQANKLYIEIINNIDGVTTNKHRPVATEAVLTAIAQVLNDDRDINEALEQAKKKIERFLRLNS